MHPIHHFECNLSEPPVKLVANEFNDIECNYLIEIRCLFNQSLLLIGVCLGIGIRYRD